MSFESVSDHLFLLNFVFSGLAHWQNPTLNSVQLVKFKKERKMTLLSRFFYKRPPDGLLEFVERVYGNILFFILYSSVCYYFFALNHMFS